MKFDMGRAALILSFAAAWTAVILAHFWGYSRGSADRGDEIAQVRADLAQSQDRLDEFAGLRDEMYDLQTRLMNEMAARSLAASERAATDTVEGAAAESPVATASEPEPVEEPTPQLEALQESASEEAPNEPVSEGDYAQLRQGMAYDEVVAALGREEDGTLTFGPAVGERSETRIWRWTGAAGEPLELTLNFESGRLTAKNCSAPWAAADDAEEAQEQEAG